ncbi:Chromate resistance protein ChrB [Streptomyces sp. NPDC059753]|uniref:Chromate resistance protein ChrB n=1 Tax=Streptomyces sp. NPDC059753 TaxID=3346933 RepID=UPI0036579140
MVAEFNAERDAEYGEVSGRAPALLAELEKETARGRANYAEVEESDADLERFDKWLAKAPHATTARGKSSQRWQPLLR